MPVGQVHAQSAVALGSGCRWRQYINVERTLARRNGVMLWSDVPGVCSRVGHHRGTGSDVLRKNWTAGVCSLLENTYSMGKPTWIILEEVRNEDRIFKIQVLVPLRTLLDSTKSIVLTPTAGRLE